MFESQGLNSRTLRLNTSQMSVQPDVTPVLIIGGGVVGLTILRTLTCDVKLKGSVMLVEAEVRMDQDVCLLLKLS